jgi:hypothetical protein
MSTSMPIIHRPYLDRLGKRFTQREASYSNRPGCLIAGGLVESGH